MMIIQKVLIVGGALFLTACGGGGESGKGASTFVLTPISTSVGPTTTNNATAATSGAVAVSM